MAKLIAIRVNQLSLDHCPISSSRLQPESSALSEDIRSIIEAPGQCPVCSGAVLAIPNPA
jgi:hypothetical protein